MAKDGSHGDRSPQSADMYAGIILVPEVNEHVTLVPPLPALRRDLFRAGRTRPLSVPFSGEYWFYYWPSRRPPHNSMVARGTPIAFKFTATGRTPLVMQARQSFGVPIDTQCCSRIDLSISNTDPLPGTVSIELQLVNSMLPEKPLQSLGEAPLMSALPSVVTDNTPAATETLSFQMPARSLLRQFNEIAIIFHLQEPRKGRSANISIERFSLVPRGL